MKFNVIKLEWYKDDFPIAKETNEVLFSGTEDECKEWAEENNLEEENDIRIISENYYSNPSIEEMRDKIWREMHFGTLTFSEDYTESEVDWALVDELPEEETLEIYENLKEKGWFEKPKFHGWHNVPLV